MIVMETFSRKGEKLIISKVDYKMLEWEYSLLIMLKHDRVTLY